MTDSDGGLDVQLLVGQIRSRGHWHVTLRPPAYNPTLLPYRELSSIPQSISVSARGWDVPRIDTRLPAKYDESWITGSTDWDYHREVWRLYQSERPIRSFERSSG